MMKIYQILINLLIISSIISISNVAQAARILELTGEVTIKRKNTQNFLPADKGMIIKYGDLIKLSETAEVKVICADADKTIKSLSPGDIAGLANFCPGNRNTNPRIGSIFPELLDGSYQYQTEIISDKPILIWPSIKDADSYQVKITVGEEVIWEKLVNDTNIIYDGSAFLPKVPYVLSVTAGNDNSPFYQLRLNRVLSVIQDTIQKEIDEIKQEDVNEEAKALMLVDVYVNQNRKLFLDAADTLETIVKTESKTPIIHRLLGDMYLYLGKTEAAKTQYLQSLELAKFGKNIEEMAASQTGLASVAVINQQLETAKNLLSQAQENYKQSGRVSDAELVQGYLSLMDN
ncbi:tetratricopeptide repeat protein [Cyanothece sp. BG0011]|uniref:tetratricopeptide repeat protein n=1 Tax=Cyanothece sp. BG0011 TaxID=2082950 RepID=UPI0013007406|nr:tetratricopeptide repeat protein [Cyanothece sp. BG0011]